MMYTVILPFFDLQDHNHQYFPGDTFPRKGISASAERLKELASANNRIGSPVIEQIKEETELIEEKPKITRKRAKEDVD